MEFKLRLAGRRNVKAARVVLGDHGGDVNALKEAEPWMFADFRKQQVGKTGLSNAGYRKKLTFGEVNGGRCGLGDEIAVIDSSRTLEWRYTEYYQVTRRFLEDPERMLRYILGRERRSSGCAPIESSR